MKARKINAMGKGLLVAALCLASASAWAGGSDETQQFLNVRVHYAAVPSGEGVVYAHAESEDVEDLAESGDRNITVAGTLENDGGNLKNHYYLYASAQPQEGYVLAGVFLDSDMGIEGEYDATDGDPFLFQNYNSLGVSRAKSGQIAASKGKAYDSEEAASEGEWSEDPTVRLLAVFGKTAAFVNPQTPLPDLAHMAYRPKVTAKVNNAYNYATAVGDEVEYKAETGYIGSLQGYFSGWTDEDGKYVSFSNPLTITATEKPQVFMANYQLDGQTQVGELGWITYSTAAINPEFGHPVDGAETKGFVVTAIEDGAVVMEEVTRVPKGTGLLIQGLPEAKVDLWNATNPSTPETNLLVGTGETAQTSDGTFFVLGNGDSGIGFYRLPADEQVPPFSAYLKVEDESVDFIALEKGEDGINAVHHTATSGKAYDIRGIRVNDDAKGLIVVDGKKILRK